MRKLLVLITAASALLAACGSATGYAAKVNGTTISQAELDREMKAILGSKQYLAKVQQQSEQTGVEVLGKGKGTLSSAYVATLLNARIASLLVHQDLIRLKSRPTKAQLDSARKRYETQFSKSAFNSLPQAYRDYLVVQLAEFDLFGEAVQKGVTAAQVKKFYDSNKEAFEQVCVSHILVDTEAEAVEIGKRLTAGEDFGAIAKEKSKDNGGGTGGSAAEGGSLGCLTQSESSGFVPEFAAAMASLAPGQTSEPVQTQFGYHVIRVTEIKVATLKDATPEIRERLGDAQERLKDLVTKAKIVINPRYGKFVKNPLRGVVPPDAPATSTSSTEPALPIPGG